MPGILVGGDVCPRGPNEPLFAAGKAETIFNDLLPEFARADFRVVNLESPLITESSPARRPYGPWLGVAGDCIKGLKAAGIDAVNLANNHIMDHGEAGLKSTIAACERAGVGWFGAGASLAEAGKVLVREIGGMRVGFYGVVDWWDCVAGAGSAGANPMEVTEMASTLRKQRPGVDFLLVLVHAGNEYYPYPSPGLRRLGRFLATAGAGAVIFQHSHCPGCHERHEGVPILYGQGNLVFHSPLGHPSGTWDEGVLVRLDIGRGRECGVQLVPHCQSAAAPGARRMPAAREKEFLAEFAGRAREIQADGFVRRKWAEFCRTQLPNYGGLIYRRSHWLARAAKRLHLGWLLRYPDRSIWYTRLFIRCETYREVLLTLLDEEVGKARQGW